MRLSWFLTLLVLPVGCSGLAEREIADARFVGRPVTELESVLGVPTRIGEVGETTLLTYEDTHPQTVPGNPFCFGPGPFCDGGGFPPPKPALAVCDSTFVVGGGVVRSFDIRGDGC